MLQRWLSSCKSTRGEKSDPNIQRIPDVSLAATGGSIFNSAHDFEINNPKLREYELLRHQVIQERPGYEGSRLLQRNIATNALPDASERFDAPRCDENTRVQLLGKVMKWIHYAPSSETILCITGPAGFGKSTLLQTLSERCAKEKVLLGGWFFYRRDPSRNSSARLIPTITYQIGVSHPHFQANIHTAIERDPSVFTQSLEQQFQTLIVGPWQSAFKPQTRHTQDQVILIDGLNECEEDQHLVISALAFHLKRHALPIRLILSSRPTPELERSLRHGGCFYSCGYHIKLSKFDASDDIRHYLKTRLEAIRRHSHDPALKVATQWPSDEDLEALVKAAAGQFVFAAIVVKHLINPRRSPTASLADVLRWSTDTKHQGVDSLYANLLNTSLAHSGDPHHTVRILRKANSFAAHPLSMIETFFCLQPNEIRRALSNLYSVISFEPRTAPGPSLRILHPTLLEFLDDPGRCGSLYVPEYIIQAEVAATAMEWILEASDGDILSYIKGLVAPPDKLIQIALEEWTNRIVQSVPGDRSIPLKDSPILEKFQQFSKEGVWHKLAKGFQSPELQNCQCQNGHHASRVARETGIHLKIFWDYVKIQFQALSTDKREGWEVVFGEIEGFFSMLWECWRRPYVEGRHCAQCVHVFRPEEYQAYAKRIVDCG